MQNNIACINTFCMAVMGELILENLNPTGDFPYNKFGREQILDKFFLYFCRQISRFNIDI